MSDQQLAVREATAIVQRGGFDDPTRELIRKTVSDPRQPLSSDEFDLFLAVCQHTGLNPLLKEIYALKTNGRFSVVPGVDGYRRLAQQSPRFRGMAGPLWCGSDGVWTDAWLGDGPPAACKVGVYLPGQREPTWAVAYYKNYRDRRTPTWQAMPEHMLAVRAEVHALRKCFGRELAGVAMPLEDDAGAGLERPAFVDADGVIDEGHPSRARAIAASIDAEVALAESEALLEEGGGEAATPFEQEQPPAGPRWASTPLGRQVSALADALTDAGKRFSLPDDDASDAELKGWLASKKTILGQRA